MANFGATFFFQGLVGGLGERLDPELVTTLCLTPVLFVFGEITPKNTFRIRADDLVYRVAGVLRFAVLFLKPVALPLTWLGRATRALPEETSAGEVNVSRGRIETLAREVAEDGILDEGQSRMVRNILRVSSLPVRHAMIELAHVDCVEEGFSREELLAVSARHGRTRIPVRRPDGRLSGVVSVLDLVFHPDRKLTEHVHPVPSLREDRTVDHALRALRSERRTMAFVAGVDGEVVGVVTMKDLVEEVSGELPVF